MIDEFLEVVDVQQQKAKHTRRYSLRNQIFLILFVTNFLLISLSSVIFYHHEKKSLIDSSIQHNLALIQQASTALDDHMVQLDAIARTIGNSALVDFILQAPPDTLSPLEYAQKLDHIRDILAIYTVNDPNIHITIFDADRIAPTMSSSAALDKEYDFTQDGIYTAFQSSSDDMIILHDNPQNYLIGSSDSDIYTFAYRIRSRYTQTTIGFLVMDIQTSSLQELLSIGDHLNWNGTILTTDGSTLVHYGDAIDEQYLDAAVNQSSIDPVPIIDDDSIVFTTQLEFSGWTILSVMDYQDILRSTSTLKSIVLITLTVMPVLVVAIALFLSRYFSKPIITLTDSIKDVEMGNLKTVAPIHRSDELGLLAQRFNEMLVKIRSLIKKNEEEASLRQKAQIQELQNRINPHFIYNTLELIAGMSNTPNAPGIRGVCNHLSAMMRYNLRPENLVLLRDELAQVEDYLAIMQQRFGSLFSYEITVLEDSILDQKFCKMTLQPLVENAIKHGFSHMKHGGMICLTVGKQQNCLYCLIQDNGCGIPPEKLEALLTAMKNTTPSTEALLAAPYHGVLNVYTRLLMLFGDRLEFRLASRIDAGTSITILIDLDDAD